jgi:hypothetical protein
MRLQLSEVVKANGTYCTRAQGSGTGSFFMRVRDVDLRMNFELMDRFVQLGGKHASELEMEKSKISEKIGTLNQPKFMRKSTSLTRMKKLPVPLP